MLLELRCHQGTQDHRRDLPGSWRYASESAQLLPLRWVKSAKKLLHNNCTPSGHLNTDAYMPTIMSHRNTKDKDSGMSPTEVVYDKNLTDAFRFMSELKKYSNEGVQPMWREAWRIMELANCHRFYSQQEEMNAHAQQLLPLQVCTKDFV